MEIYIVLSKTGTLFSRALAFFAHSKYIHTSISFDAQLRQMYSFGRLRPNNPFIGGFIEEDIRLGVYQFSQFNECKVYRMEITPDQYKQLRKEIDVFVEHASKFKYNLLGLLGLKFKISYLRKHHYFCSQFVSELMVKINVLDHTIRPEWMSPPELIELLDIDLVYEGFVSDYPYLNDYLENKVNVIG